MNDLGIDRQSSIENEPRTLNINQIEFAREAALHVVNTRTTLEALTIFTEGHEPVVGCAEGGKWGFTGEDEEYCNSDDKIRDIASAPF